VKEKISHAPVGPVDTSEVVSVTAPLLIVFVEPNVTFDVHSASAHPAKLVKYRFSVEPVGMMLA
jgi:hypothetical protein